MVKTSAKVGDLYVPAATLESFLGRFVSQLVFWNHDDVFKVSVVGSAIGVHHSGRHLLLCSRHQLRGRQLQDLGLLLPDGSSLVTSAGSRTFTEGEHTLVSDVYDLAAFDFTEPIAEQPLLAGQFFNFRRAPPDTQNTNLIAFIIVGFPSADQNYELEDKNHLGIVKRILVAVPDGQPTDEGLLRLKYVKKLDFDPDGLSGGPAFVVQLVDGEPHVFLGGMVVRSNQDFCHILKSGYLWQFVSGFP